MGQRFESYDEAAEYFWRELRAAILRQNPKAKFQNIDNRIVRSGPFTHLNDASHRFDLRLKGSFQRLGFAERRWNGQVVLNFCEFMPYAHHWRGRPENLMYDDIAGSLLRRAAESVRLQETFERNEKATEATRKSPLYKKLDGVVVGLDRFLHRLQDDGLIRAELRDLTTEEALAVAAFVKQLNTKRGHDESEVA